MSHVFPKWFHHKDHESKIFNSSDELSAAGPGWVHTQAELGPKQEPIAVDQVDAILEVVSVEPVVTKKKQKGAK